MLVCSFFDVVKGDFRLGSLDAKNAAGNFSLLSIIGNGFSFFRNWSQLFFLNFLFPSSSIPGRQLVRLGCGRMSLPE